MFEKGSLATVLKWYSKTQILSGALLGEARNDSLTAFLEELFSLGIHIVVGGLDLLANPQVQTP